MAADCNNQIAKARLRSIGVASRARLRHKNHPNEPAAARIASVKTHIGQDPNSTNVPFENTLGGYLKSNSNIQMMVLFLD
jgi:hypothetical protein